MTQKQMNINDEKLTIIDRTFTIIVCAQAKVVKLEEWYNNNKNKNIEIVVSFAFLLIAFLWNMFQTNVAFVFMCIAFVFLRFYNFLVYDIGWRSSAVKCLKICFVYSCKGAIVLSLLLRRFVSVVALLQIFVFSFLFIWFFMSLIANSKVSLLVNEVVSGFTATIFTIATYIFFNIMELDKTSLKNDIKFLLLLLLLIVGVSAFSVIMVKLKQYWMEKNGIIEPGVD